MTLDHIFADVIREDLYRPGFALLEAGGLPSDGLRARLVEIGRQMVAWRERRCGELLSWRSLTWFSQLSATRPHRDGGPDASVLLLGYEPTPVRSRVFLLDFSRAAHGLGISPRVFLDTYNPMVNDGAKLLKPHTVEVAGIDPSRAQILLVNNGCLGGGGWLGLLHHAKVESASPGTARPISSVLLGVAEGGLTEAELAAFVRDGTGASA
jgi:hypothetical protein